MPPSVLITGASSGIGAASARHLHAKGWSVIGTSRNPSRLPADAPPIRWVAMDVRDDASVAKAVEQVFEASPRLDALVCNAGFGIFGPVEETTVEAAREQFETNFFGVLRTLRAVLPRMREARQGRIVLVGSLAGRAPVPFWSHYAASKAAIEALALSLRSEVQHFGVKVSLLEPGDIATEFNDRMDWGEHDASAYGNRLRRTAQVIRESLPKAPPPEVAARAIERALSARRPRVRYTVGQDSWLVPLGRRILPDSLMLRIIRSRFRA